MKCHLSVRSSPGSLQGVGCGLPDTALPAERHLVLRADVPVGSLSPPGLSLLLPEHCPGPPHHHTALQPRQEGQALFVCVCYYVLHLQVSVCQYVRFNSFFMFENIASRARRTMADACASRSAVQLPLPALRTR